jgi:hypothetical protein
VRADVEIEVRLPVEVVCERANDDVRRAAERVPGGDVASGSLRSHALVAPLPPRDVLRAQDLRIWMRDHEHGGLECGPMPVELEEPQVRFDDRCRMRLQIRHG